MANKKISAEFYQGFAVAIGTLARDGEPSRALDIMRSNGVTMKDLRRSGADKFDLEPLEQELELMEESDV